MGKRKASGSNMYVSKRPTILDPRVLQGLGNAASFYVNRAVDATIRKFSTGSQTATQYKAKKTNSKGTTSSRTAGKLTMNAKYKKYRKTSRNKAQLNGHVSTYERNQTYSTTNQCAYIGHYSHPSNVVRIELFRSILKKLLADCKIYIQGFDHPLSNYGFIVADTFLVSYEAPVGTVLTEAYNLGAGDTLATVAAYFGSISRAYWSSTVALLGSIQFSSSSSSIIPRAYLDLRNTTVSIMVRSHMKFQNRTLNTATNDSTDEVDNMPIYGKGYLVRGNMPNVRFPMVNGTTVNQLAANNDNGVIETSGSAGAGNLPEEPPEPALWEGVSKTGRLRIDPGQIKTSSLVVKESHLCNTWLSLLKGATAPFGNTGKMYFGKTKLFVIEKIINSDNARPIIVSYEHNFTMYVTIQTRRAQQVKPIFQAL